MILALAEILRLKKLRQADDLRATSDGVGNPGYGLFEILLGLWAARHLHQCDAKFLRGHALPTSANKYSRRKLSARSRQRSVKPLPGIRSGGVASFHMVPVEYLVGKNCIRSGGWR